MTVQRGQSSVGFGNFSPEPSTLPPLADNPQDIIEYLLDKLDNLTTLVAGKADKDQIRTLIQYSDEAVLIQAKDIVVAGDVTFVELLNEYNGTTNGLVPGSLTRIVGGRIQTGVITSNNYGPDAGTALDLDNGILILGGEDNPSLFFEDGDLYLSGSITASSFILRAGPDPDPTLEDLLQLAEGALPSAEFEGALNAQLAAGVESVLAGMDGDYRLNLGTGSVVIAHKDINLAGLGAGYTGDLRSGVAITGTGIALGFNDKTTGAWKNAVVIGATGDVTLLGTLTAGSIIAGTVTTEGVSLNTIRTNAADGYSLNQALLNGGSAVLTGVIQPTNTGGIRTGTITWNPTTGALTGGTGVAVTEYGIVGASSGSPTFVLEAATGNATFSGTLSAATGTFVGDVETAGSVYAYGFTTTSKGTGALVANGSRLSPSDPYRGVTGVLAYSDNGYAGEFVVEDVPGIAITATHLIGGGYAADFRANNGVGLRVAGNFGSSSTTGVAIEAYGQTDLNGQTLIDLNSSVLTALVVTNTLGTAISAGTVSFTTAGISTANITTANVSADLNLTGSGNIVLGTATSTGINNFIMKNGSAGARLGDQIIILSQDSGDAQATLHLIVEEDVVAGTGPLSGTGINQLKIRVNGTEFWLPVVPVV